MAAIAALVNQQREYFRTGVTRDIGFRERQLDRLGEGLRAHGDRILEALRTDLGKAPAEGYMAELLVVFDELKVARKKVRSWARPRRVPSPILQAVAS